ncbi:hypothetical protein OH77DRAFT_1590626 [Trametes cingulata]|nr:hypothetical protein OH77DRAFT_1590626 [Trametes cingulata]
METDRGTNRSTLDEISIRRQAIAREIAALEEEDRTLAAAWNSYQPVERLLDEILVNVFELCWDETPSGNGWTWTKLRYACRRWNRVICQTAAFWTTVDALNPCWLRLCLVRSEESLLDVVFTKRPPSIEDVQELHPHASRIRSLRAVLSYTSEPWVCRILPVLNNFCPALESLRLGRCLTRTEDVNAKLSNECHPTLKHLHIYGVRLAVDPPLFSGLRQLSIQNCSLSLSVDRLLDALSMARHLHTLCIVESLEATANSESDVSCKETPVVLPQLIHLGVIGHSPHLTASFLSRLRPSVHCAVKVDGPLRYSAGNIGAITASELLPPFPLREQVLPIIVSPLVTDITILASESSCELRTDTYSPPGRPPAGKLILNVHDPGIIEEWPCLQRAMADLVDVFRYAPLTRLSVTSTYGGLDDADWDAVFVTFPTLVHLVLSGPERTGAVWIALKAGLGDMPSDVETVRCPRLESITREEFEESHALFAEILDCVRKRSEAGSYLKSLNLITHDADHAGDIKDLYMPEIAACVLDEVYFGEPTGSRSWY